MKETYEEKLDRMTPQQADKIIVEAMGKCWHILESVRTNFQIGKRESWCKIEECWIEGAQENPSPSSSWSDYGEVLEWAQIQIWWEEFIKYWFTNMERWFLEEWKVCPQVCLNPQLGSLALAEFIQQNQRLMVQSNRC